MEEAGLLLERETVGVKTLKKHRGRRKRGSKKRRMIKKRRMKAV